jgi:hypothetical protein
LCSKKKEFDLHFGHTNDKIDRTFILWNIRKHQNSILFFHNNKVFLSRFYSPNTKLICTIIRKYNNWQILLANYIKKISVFLSSTIQNILQ